jgi:hypothetical protein
VSEPVIEPDPLWPVWRTLVREFRTRRLFRHLSVSRSGMGLYGADVISTLRETPMARGGLAVLADVSDELLLRLGDLAALNARRNESLWKLAVLFYVSVPMTLFLTGLEGAPEVAKQMLARSFGVLAVCGGLMTLWLLYYFGNQWRARQIEAVIELARIERGLQRFAP